MNLSLEFGQVWTSKDSPHEDFRIYGGTDYTYEFFWFWERVNEDAFDKFMIAKKGATVSDLLKQGRNTYPYAWAGECNGSALKSKIKKFNMELKS